MADIAADTVDARTVEYLLHAALGKKKQEEERRNAKEDRRLEVTADCAQDPASWLVWTRRTVFHEIAAALAVGIGSAM